MKVRTEERRKEKVFEEYTLVEKLLPPFLNWMVRKVFLGLCVVLLTVSKLVAGRFRFSIEASVSDREEWNWNFREKFPLYKAKVEKVN